jgi:hypothetical protein
MMKMGFTNVKHVHGGGKAMHQYFEYYLATANGWKIINPITGKEVIFKKP